MAIFSPPRGASPVLALTAAVALLAAVPARAQGTAEQRETCAPDAIKLCQDTIPNVEKTTACMKAHVAELSPRCRIAFNAATGGGASPAPSREPHATRESLAPAPAPDDDSNAPETVPGLHAYAAQIRRYCREGLVDAFTCRNTLDALKASE